MRFPILRNSRTLRPSTLASGGSTLRSRNGLASRTCSMGSPTMRGSSAVMYAEMSGSSGITECSVIEVWRPFIFLNGVAAVNNDELAGDVGGGLRGEKRDRGGDFVRAARATHRGISSGDDLVFRRRSRLNPA